MFRCIIRGTVNFKIDRCSQSVRHIESQKNVTSLTVLRASGAKFPRRSVFFSSLASRFVQSCHSGSNDQIDFNANSGGASRRVTNMNGPLSCILLVVAS